MPTGNNPLTYSNPSAQGRRGSSQNRRVYPCTQRSQYGADDRRTTGNLQGQAECRTGLPVSQKTGVPDVIAVSEKAGTYRSPVDGDDL